MSAPRGRLCGFGRAATEPLADRARRRALAALLQLAAAVPVRPWEPCGSTPAQLAAAAVAVLLLYGRPRLYRPRHRQRRIRSGVVAGVVRVRA